MNLRDMIDSARLQYGAKLKRILSDIDEYMQDLEYVRLELGDLELLADVSFHVDLNLSTRMLVIEVPLDKVTFYKVCDFFKEHGFEAWSGPYMQYYPHSSVNMMMRHKALFIIVRGSSKWGKTCDINIIQKSQSTKEIFELVCEEGAKEPIIVRASEQEVVAS